jgi:hypothetical protein
MILAVRAITCVVGIMILAAGTIMVMVFAAGAVMFAAVVLLRGNFSVGTSTMGAHYEKPPPWELSLWASSVGTLHEKPLQGTPIGSSF